ncbi:MAG: helix-turn-helix domain-containing protein, partial [Methanocorpusculum sp.]|nr:helix-turn-helix domain-containing protein [Methanocorpusculum sp.]
MNESEFISEMLSIGMTEYEAKVYFILFQLKYASIRDISEICTVPRNKIYEALSSLEEKGFSSRVDDNPLRYALCDIDKTFNAIRSRELEKIKRAEQYLKKKEESARLGAG